ncbi:sacsin isoform X1 [Scophthalmus maximus]|uniref:sacsin isoform X1 n=1 Tax=Scophthalmus maximus TaxID=52904 RepID=UPI001FA8D1E4|nr:sacsin isoform X1 [Scophthalmus maximus]
MRPVDRHAPASSTDRMMSLKTKRKARTSFGATAPPFIDYLKDILGRYPDGGQILKELIQNADDARATEVVFIHDERSYGTESLWTDELGKYQGPALYAYNNAAFTDADWEGIQRAGRSDKRNDPDKVGRFGIGFNSVYHTTDVPSIFSSVHLGLMDPQEKIFGERNGGFLWSLDDPEHQEALMIMHDQFQPFRDVVSLVSERKWSEVVLEDQFFDGTIFRFPLRNEASEISDNLYDSDRVVELFSSFIADADLSLLFLKNVTSVSLVHIDVHGTVNTRLKVQSSFPTNDVLESNDASVTEASTRFKVITLHSDVHKETKWLVTTCTMREGNVDDLDSLAKKLSFSPQVDLAFPCGEQRDCRETRLSCFLPLPNNESNKTGLPVYVNACFGLSDNRRLIKWREEDQKHDEHAVWNELLMKEVLPRAYLTLIQDAIKLAQQSVLPVRSVYDLWPDIARIQRKDKWYAIALDVLSHLFKQNVAVLSLAKDERKFITASEAVFPCNGPTSPEMLAAIQRTLVSCGENLVTLPGSVARAINEACPYISTLKHVTPAFVKDILRRIGVHDISKDDRLRLLEYILSDGEYGELEGLQLLPLNDGSFRSFTNREEDTALIDSNEFPRSLLPCCKHLFIPDDLSPTCITHLSELARKNLYKVINIGADHVAEYTRRYLPQDWQQTTTGLVAWNIGSSQHPPLEWLQEFWKFLSTHFKELSRFTGIPLIPVSPLSVSQVVSLAQLQQNTSLISQKRKMISLPDQIAQLVNKASGTVVRGNEWLQHVDLDSYVLCPSPRSVVKVLVNLDSQHLIGEVKSASHTAREELKDYLSRLDSLSRCEKDLLSKLPLFQTMKGVYSAAQSKQALLLTSGLTVPTELPMPDSVVQCATEADHRLLRLLKVNLLHTAEAVNLLIDCIQKGSCSKEETEKIMTWILQHGNVLFSQNQTLKRRCKDLGFIEVNGELKKASSFFDPRIQNFTVIFESHFFPPRPYTHTEQMLESLTDLGLLCKEVDVSPQHLLHAATLIDKMHVESQAEAQKRAQVLLKMLDANDLLSKFSSEQLKRLKMLKWVPCDQPGNDQHQGSCFFCPDEIRHSAFKDIVGHVMPLVGDLSDRVSNKLGLKGRPPPEKVMENLSVLTSKAQEMNDPDTDVDFKTELRSIYRHMQDYISEFAPMINEDTRWLWSHNKFVSPKDLVLDYPHNLDLSSYIGKVPSEFLSYKKLLRNSGLRTLISDGEVIGILHSIQQNIEGRQEPFASSSEVKVSIEILNWLWREKKAVKDDIPVPVILEGEQYTLKPRSTAVFCDVSKGGLKELKCSLEEVHVIHDEIPKATAEWLNIQFLSTFILNPELVGIEQCGQSEPITTRIKNILKEYDEESDIFKELIQNAEDAGAEVCKFLVDFRVHKDAPESLIDPNMALCQGPCLWAFNNEQFTVEDWENIVRVGSASKENKVEKIGKFGLGFNTVYHVTDVPSILSGNSLLIFDPNVTHLKKHIKHKTNPGIKLDLSQQHLFHCFPGQFGPYERIFDCNFSRQSPPEPFPGTLIKLPFRTEEEALKSEISTKVYHKHNIITFQQHLTKNSQTHLLFLKKVNALSLQSVPHIVSTPPRDDEIETVLTISKTTVSAMTIPDEACVSKQRQAEESLMKLDGKCKEVIDSSTANVVQITSQQSGVTEVQSWLLYNCFGTRESLKMALQGNKKAKFFLPIGGIAVPLQNNPKTGKLTSLQTDLVGQAFSFLPLSIHTGLPVNVNGTFAVTSNRKGLWESGVKNDWNKALLRDPVVTAYVTTLLTLRKMSENKQLEDYCYHTFWPDREKVSETFKPLVDAFYSTIAQQSIGPELFSDGDHWCSMNTAIFLHESIEEDKEISALAVQVCKKYAKPQNNVVHLPLWMKNSFKQAGLEKALQDRTWNWERFYQEVVFNNLGTIEPVSRDSLVLHAIDLHVKEIDNLLVCYPCIPTTDGRLQYIEKLVNPSGRVASLFEPEEGRLLGGTKKDFCSPERIKRLLELGMASDYLPLKEITEKAGSITKTWSTDRKKAYGQLKCLLEVMKYHMNDTDSLQWETLRMTEFLPALSPGDMKMEINVTLRRPTDVFSDKCPLLVNMTQPVLDHTNLNIHNTDPVLQILGVRDSPRPETVLQQLQETCKQSQSTDRPVFHKIAFECYKFLDQWLSDSGDPAFISQSAHSFPFILVGSTFVNVNCVAENEQFEAKPYLHMLPPAFTSFKKLWESIGVEKKYTVSQFETVLQDLHHRHGKKPLPEKDLSMCRTILNKGIYEAKEKTTGDCLIPNEHGILQPASELFYNDSPWMPVVSGVTLCHEDISRAMACYFGIKTTRHHTLQSHIAENISPFAFEFAQQEQLTVRIKNIISAYPSKKDILKELIQNADDAEATEIHFVWDKRQHGKEKTFGDKWNHLQGSALCVFNNKVFSDVDLAGIQQLGEGGKHNSPGKTGKYGVGFNSVYHLTDCPSILTGDEFLCISDPNQKYIEHHSGKPLVGIGYKLADKFKEMYVDVYKSFLPEQFPLKDGTMFRLPLRMGTMANGSKISEQGVTDRDMEELCSALSEDPEGLILFLKNIRKIKVHEINACSGELKTVFGVDKSVPQTSREKEDAFVNLQQQALQSDQPATPHKAIYETTISTSDKRQSKWIIAQQFGSFKNSDGREATIPNKLPQAAVAARIQSLGTSSKYGCTNDACKDFKGEAFCSLPLPGTTGLPVHVNANFEVDSSRRNLWKEDGQSLKTKWNESLNQRVIAPLYADLLHYISQSIEKKKVSVSCIESCFNNSYLCFWPTASKDVNQHWHEMIHEVYRSIKERGLHVIPVMRSSTCVLAGRPLKQYSFDWCDMRETEATKALYLSKSTDSENYEISLVLEDLGMKLVPTSTKMKEVWENFKSIGVELKRVHPSTVRTFLKEKPLNDPTQTDEALPLPITSTLIRDERRCSELLRFCLKDPSLKKKVSGENSRLLDGLPLLLTGDKVLRMFNSRSPKLVSGYQGLFLDCKDQFADFRTNLEHMDVLQRFNLVKNLTVHCAAEYLKPLIQHHLQSCEVDSHSGLHVPNQAMLTWLNSLWRFLESQIKPTAASGDEQSVTFSDVRQLFNDCSILPVVCPRLNNKHLLQTMKDMPSVIQFASDRNISGILIKLGFMRLDNVFFYDMLFDRQTHLFLQPELMDVNDTSSVLDQVYNINHSEFSLLSPEDKRELQNSLQSGVSKAKDSQDYQRKLKSLPLFETICGKTVRIDGPKEVFVLKITHLSTFPDLFTLPDSDNIFLKDSPENCSLSQSLSIKILTDMEYFMRFILPVAHKLTERQLLHCFKLLLSLQDDCKYSQYKEKIISSMKRVKFIRNSQGKLDTASYYFDDCMELYKKMLPQERFVPVTFWTECGYENQIKANQLLRELGMKHVVSKDEIIAFAYQLESEAKGNSPLQELKEKSLLLFKTALEKGCNNENEEEKLLESIADIKFIFPVTIRKELCNYHQPFAAERTAVKIRSSLMDINRSHQDLIWSSMPIIHLPVYQTEELLQMMKDAGAHDQPPTQCVTSNISNICRSPCKTDELIKTRARVFRSSYTYLHEKGFEEQPLAGLPIVLVENDKELVRTDEVSLSLRDDQEFRPYLYKIRPKDLCFMDFFKKIGVKKEPTAVQYCNVLAAVYADTCEKTTLNPNQLKTVKRAVQQLFGLIKAQENQSFPDEVESLHLPAVDGKLYPSCTLYYNDTTFEPKRLEEALENKFLMLEKLSEYHLGSDIYGHHRLLKMLPQNLQPKMLSQFTEEKVVELHMQLCEFETDCEFSGWFDKHLSSFAFRHGLICLIRYQSRGEITHEDAAHMCDETFGSIQIVCCKNLETKLWLMEQPLDRTTAETDVFVKRGQRGCMFYLKHNDDMAPKVITEVNMTLTKEIHALLGDKFEANHLPVLGQFLMCDSLQDIQKTLAKNGIHDSTETKSCLFKPPPPGTDIPEEWLDSLDMNILNNFEEGEYVGYSTDRYIHAVIVEEVPGNSGIYSHRYKVDIGEDEPIEVSCLDLYQFKREKNPKRGRTRKSAGTSCMDVEPLAGAVPHHSGSSTGPSTRPSTPRSSPASVDEAKREIDKCLAEIWTLPEEQRHKAIKRLYLRWHPDKNPDYQFLSTEAFKYLQNRIEELRNGKGKTEGSSYPRGNSDFRDFYSQWNQEARDHRNGRERFSKGFHSYNFWTHNENVPRPDREEAQRWCRQARCDLRAAHTDSGEGSTEWCLFKVHQAVEKLLIAAEYKKHGQHPTISSISALAAQVSSYNHQLAALPQIVQNLKMLGVDPKKTQYPNCHPSPHIPNGQFKSENGMQALNKASELLSVVEAYVK